VKETIAVVVRRFEEYLTDGIGYVLTVVHIVSQISVNVDVGKAVYLHVLNVMQEFILHCYGATECRLVYSCTSTKRYKDTLGENGVISMLINKLHILGQLFSVGFCLFSILDGNLNCWSISVPKLIGLSIDLTDSFSEHIDRGVILLISKMDVLMSSRKVSCGSVWNITPIILASTKPSDACDTLHIPSLC
jgi:hypothetical protein